MWQTEVCVCVCVCVCVWVMNASQSKNISYSDLSELSTTEFILNYIFFSKEIIETHYFIWLRIEYFITEIREFFLVSKWK